MKRQIACIVRRIGKWLVCVADRMTAGTETVQIVIDSSKRKAAVQAIESECNLDAIREAGRKARMERARQSLVAA